MTLGKLPTLATNDPLYREAVKVIRAAGGELVRCHAKMGSSLTVKDPDGGPDWILTLPQFVPIPQLTRLTPDRKAIEYRWLPVLGVDPEAGPWVDRIGL